LHLKVLINFFFFIIIIIIITIIVVVIVLLLTIIYTINLPVVRPRSCRVIYYFDTPTLGRRHQSFGRVSLLNVNGFYNTLLSFLDHVVEQQFLTFSARQILIFAAIVEQLIDELQSFILIVDSSMSRLNWSITEHRKKLRLDLSLSL
jgi:hypothetical protein